MKISMKLIYQYEAIFFNFPPTSSLLHPLQVENCDSNLRLVVDEDDNGKFRPERVKRAVYHFPGEKYLYLFNFRRNISKSWCSNTHFVRRIENDSSHAQRLKGFIIHHRHFTIFIMRRRPTLAFTTLKYSSINHGDKRIFFKI